MYPKALFLFTLATVASAAGPLKARKPTKHSVSCSTISGNTQKTKTSTLTSDCTSWSTSYSTTVTTTQLPPTTTTVYTTTTFTDNSVIPTATSTATETKSASTTTTLTDTSTASSVVTSTSTSYWPTAAATKRDVEERGVEVAAKTHTLSKAPKPTGGVICIVYVCATSSTSAVVTSTKTLDASTSTNVETVSTTITPSASTTVFVTTTYTTVSTETDTTTATYTPTTVITYTPTPTVLITSSGNSQVADGTPMDAVLVGSYEYSFFYPGTNQLFTLNPSNGYLQDANTSAIATADSGFSYFLFASQAVLAANSWEPCTCSISHSLALNCNCAYGDNIFLVVPQDVDYVTVANANYRGGTIDFPQVTVLDQN